MGSQIDKPNDEESLGAFFTVQGCAAGKTVWKVIPVDDCACDQSVKYVDEDGNVSTTEPDGWSGVACGGPLPLKNTVSATAPSLTTPADNTAFKNQIVTVGEVLYFVDDTGKAAVVEKATQLPLTNTSSGTAPSTADPLLNTAFKNQMVTVGGVVYFVDSNGKAVIVERAEQALAEPVSFAIAIGTQAQLTALANKVPGERYIVTDGPNAGDVLRWNVDTNAAGAVLSSSFGVAKTTPALVNGEKWTILTNATGSPAGVYIYTLATDTWAKASDVLPLVSIASGPVSAGGIRMPGRYLAPRSDNGGTYILGDCVAGHGQSNSYHTDDGSIVSPAAGEGVRKRPFTYYQNNIPYAALSIRDAWAVDVQMNNAGAVAIDDVGILYYSGSAAFMTAMTDSDNGVSTAITPAFVPDAFWAKRAVKVIKFWLSYASNNLIALAGDGTIWVRGASGTSGIYGNGTVVANKVWNQVAIPAKKYTKIYIAADATPCCGALGADGTMYVWGANATQRILAGATTVISTPTLVPGFVGNPITDFAMDANSTMLIAGGVRHAIGINTTAGKFGDGTGNANTVYEALPSNGFVYSKVFSGDADGSEFYYYLTTDKRAVMTGRNNQQFNSGASGANITTPTLMGTGAYQGSVIDIRAHAGSALIHTDQGTVWTSVGATGAANGENGWGTNAVLASGQNLFKRVPVPGLVVGVQSSSNSVASTFGAQYTVLTDRGILYSWGAAAFQIGNQIRFAPAEIPTQGFRQLTPKTNSQLDLAP